MLRARRREAFVLSAPGVTVAVAAMRFRSLRRVALSTNVGFGRQL